ncbi:MAG: hypothetical protein SP1CHLAM54_01680 [Chlamydiia bacterium]|nr:hypothetical protein [Chlamydiia bacterium]MCH9615086.1 hypothetical protein [Chlamydiia bacterium]MCH9628592.1 hypothetical protein [Chlamydiia bacterium]
MSIGDVISNVCNYEFLSQATSNVVGEWKNILLNTFEVRNGTPIEFSHFNPATRFGEGEDEFTVVDLTNNDPYGNEELGVIRGKCLALSLTTPIVHAVTCVVNVANRVGKVVSLSHFWWPSGGDYSLISRAVACGKDILQVVMTPIVYVGLELSALYGLAMPLQGRKLFATFERYAFGDAVLAPCFQPSAERHLGGASASVLNAW